jgi:hypothetical protein
VSDRRRPVNDEQEKIRNPPGDSELNKNFNFQAWRQSQHQESSALKSNQ